MQQPEGVVRGAFGYDQEVGSAANSPICVISEDTPAIASFLGEPHNDETSEFEASPRIAARDLAVLLSECFWLSQMSEEGRPIRGTIVIREPAAGSVDEVRFTEAQPFGRDLLARLLTASPQQGVGVSHSAAGPQVWGFGDEGLFPDDLRVQVIGPGCVVARCGARTLIVGKGLVSFIAHDPLAWVLFERFPAPDSGKFVERILEGVEYIRALVAQGHGGGLLFVPDAAWRKDLELPLAVHEESREFAKRTIGVLAPREGTGAERVALWPNAKSDAARHRRRIAGWSAVDGFVVMTFRLEVLGFGAKLVVAEDPDRIVRCSALGSPEEEVKLADLGGTRHQNSARYAGAHPECLVLAASADGRLTGFCFDRKRTRLVVTTDLQFFL